MNPLLASFNTPFETIPFEEIKNEHFLPAIKEAIQEAKKEIEAIKNNSETPSFKNTIEALEQSGDKLNRAATVLFNLNSAETSDELQNITQEISPLLTEYSNDILLDDILFEKVKKVFDKKIGIPLSPEQKTLLEKRYKSFVRNGANLNAEDKAKLRELDKELSQLSLQFGKNLLADINAYALIIDKEEDLVGLPDAVKEMALENAKELGKEGKWAFTLHYPSYIPFMKYAKNRALREELYRAFASRGCKGNEFDNKEILKKIAQLRHQRANLLGYETHAHFILEERMAQSPERVKTFLNDILEPATPAAQKELEELKSYAKKLDNLEDLQRWDFSFYSEKLKKEKFNIDDEALKPYFKLENVIEGVFTVANKLYGITFEERKDIPKYHPEVVTYEVKDEKGEYLAVFYADFFPRKGKRSGAWMTSYLEQKWKDGKDLRPHVSIVCNFTKPTEKRPSLLTFNEVTTLFHEFGHALHGMLAKSRYSSLSGTSVFWDFVELPSQIMENWVCEKETLDLFAKHYETGEKIPMELIEKIKESATFLEGYQTLRQLSFGLLDMAWHAQNPSNVEDIQAFENEVMGVASVLPDVEGAMMSPAFSHIFQGGYSAGYYSYKWAEVLDADAFELFKEKGIFDKKTAQSFRDNILSKGGSEAPLSLYKRFRGQEPDPKALLRRAGLLK